MEKVFHANGKINKAGVATLVSDKSILKQRDKRQRRTLHNDQGINPKRRYNNCEYVCIQYRSI